MKTEPMTIAAFAKKLSDAYSTRRYRGWSGCIRMMRKRGMPDDLIETVIRSKWTRWAADSADRTDGYATSADLKRMLDPYPTNEAIEQAFARDFQ